MGDLTNGAILGGLVGPVSMECFCRRKSDKDHKGEKGGNTGKLFHNPLTLIIYAVSKQLPLL